jgi:hypothetical protein
MFCRAGAFQIYQRLLPKAADVGGVPVVSRDLLASVQLHSRERSSIWCADDPRSINDGRIGPNDQAASKKITERSGGAEVGRSEMGTSMRTSVSSWTFTRLTTIIKPGARKECIPPA